MLLFVQKYAYLFLHLFIYTQLIQFYCLSAQIPRNLEINCPKTGSSQHFLGGGGSYIPTSPYTYALPRIFNSSRCLEIGGYYCYSYLNYYSRNEFRKEAGNVSLWLRKENEVTVWILYTFSLALCLASDVV